MFGRLRLQGQSDVFLVINIFEVSFTEEVTVSLKGAFEGELKCAASEARNKFDRTASADQGAIGERLGGDF